MPLQLRSNLRCIEEEEEDQLKPTWLPHHQSPPDHAAANAVDKGGRSTWALA